KLNELLANVPGVLTPQVDAADHSTFWFYMLRLDPSVITVTPEEFAKTLSAEGVPCSAGYIGVPLYQYPIFQNANFLGGRWPTRELGLTDMDYNQVRCLEAEAILKTAVR